MRNHYAEHHKFASFFIHSFVRSHFPQNLILQLALLETRLHIKEEERLILKKDVEESSLSKETLMKRAWSSRDAAVARKNVAEVELARGRIEGMQVRLESS
jgi:hypothetical protein